MLRLLYAGCGFVEGSGCMNLNFAMSGIGFITV